jgi:ribonuclease P protein subunit POP4
MISKSNNSWKFSINNQDIILDGSKITKRPFDRIGGKA